MIQLLYIWVKFLSVKYFLHLPLQGRNPLLKNYMEMQKDITPHMRGILINWLIEVV